MSPVDSVVAFHIAEVAFGSVRGVEPNESPVHLLHHREAFASNVDGVLAMRLSCKEEKSGKGCLRRVLVFFVLAVGECRGVGGTGLKRRVPSFVL